MPLDTAPGGLDGRTPVIVSAVRTPIGRRNGDLSGLKAVELLRHVQLEAIALSDTLSFVFNSPYTIGDKIMHIMAGFGLKKEEQERESARPEEHRTNGNSNGTEEKAEDKTEKAEDKTEQ